MSTYKADTEAVIKEPLDRGEDIAVMETLQISHGSPHQAALAELVLAMNCYFGDCSRMIFGGSKIRKAANAFAWNQLRFEPAMTLSVTMWRAVQERCHAF